MNFAHKAARRLYTGKSGSGKTTLFEAETVADPARWKMAFDPRRQFHLNYGWTVTTDVPGMIAAIKSGKPFLFDSAPLFPGDRPEGFRFWCRWVLSICRVLSGKKLLAIEEIQSVQKPGNGGCPPVFIEILDDARADQVDVNMIVQRPNRVNDEVRGQLTEIVTLLHTDKHQLDWLEYDGFDRKAVKRLKKPGGYIRRNLDTEEETTNATTSDPAGNADRPLPAKIRVAQSHCGPLQPRRADGRFSSLKSAEKAGSPRLVHG